ncbi:MAG: hypothetical protein AAF213_01075 [Pseudomonadota bacterium]
MSVGQHKRERLKAALVACRGNAGEARRRLMKELETDDLLFREIAAPFMHGIVSHAIDNYAKSLGLPTSFSPSRPTSAEAEAPPAQELDPDILDQVIGQMGKNQPQAPSSQSAGGKDSNHDPQKQANTMRALADLYKKKRVSEGY